MINENLITSLLETTNKQKLRMKELYEQCTNKDDRQLYRNAYLRALDSYSSRYLMVVAFGYDVVTDENGNIIGIKKI